MFILYGPLQKLYLIRPLFTLRIEQFLLRSRTALFHFQKMKYLHRNVTALLFLFTLFRISFCDTYCIHTRPFIAYFTYQTDHNCHLLCYNLFSQCEQRFLKLSSRPLKPLETFSNLSRCYARL